MMRLSGSNTKWFSVLLALLAAVAMVGCGGGGGGSSSGSSGNSSYNTKSLADIDLNSKSTQVIEGISPVIANFSKIINSAAASVRASDVSSDDQNSDYKEIRD